MQSLRAGFIIAALAAVSIPFRPDAVLAGRPVSEDGFYVLTIARHIAAGDGITIDGVTPTNGFQPLHTFVVAALAWIAGGDRLALIRLVLVFAWLTHIAAAAVLGRIVSRLVGDRTLSRAVFWATMLVYTALRLVVLDHYNGLETGLMLLLLAVTWHWWQQGGARTTGAAVITGVLLGLCVLARLDMVFLVATITVAMWTPASRAARSLSARVAVPLVAAAILAPWLAYSHGVSGTLMPTSGLAQQRWDLSGARMLAAAGSLAQNVVPASLGALEGTWTNATRMALAPLLVWWVVRFGALPPRDHPGAARDGLAFASMLALAVVLLAGWYTLSSWATHFYTRYLAGLLLLSCAALGYALGWIASRRPRVAVLLVALGSLQAVAYCAALYSGVYAGTFLSTRAVWSRHLFGDQLALVLDRVPPGDLVAAGQSGTLGYFRDRVVNVDGKVNRDALARQDRMTVYLDERGVRWFCDMPDYVERYLGTDPVAAGWQHVATEGLFHLYRRR